MRSASTWPAARSTCWSTTPSWNAAGPTGSRCRPGSTTAYWASTPSWSGRPRAAQSAADASQQRRLGEVLGQPQPLMHRVELHVDADRIGVAGQDVLPVTVVRRLLVHHHVLQA